VDHLEGLSVEGTGVDAPNLLDVMVPDRFGMENNVVPVHVAWRVSEGILMPLELDMLLIYTI